MNPDDLVTGRFHLDYIYDPRLGVSRPDLQKMMVMAEHAAWEREVQDWQDFRSSVIAKHG